MKLSHIRKLGRYIHIDTGQKINVKKGYNQERGTDHIFYLYRGKRISISESDFYRGKYKKIDE
jgi:hypothetical protein